MTATEQVRGEASVEALADAAGALMPRSVKHIAASWHSKAAALSKKVVRRNSSTLSWAPAGCCMEVYTLSST